MAVFWVAARYNPEEDSHQYKKMNELFLVFICHEENTEQLCSRCPPHSRRHANVSFVPKFDYQLVNCCLIRYFLVRMLIVTCSSYSSFKKYGKLHTACFALIRLMFLSITSIYGSLPEIYVVNDGCFICSSLCLLCIPSFTNFSVQFGPVKLP
jgi:hypothetical protein